MVSCELPIKVNKNKRVEQVVSRITGCDQIKGAVGLVNKKSLTNRPASALYDDHAVSCTIDVRIKADSSEMFVFHLLPRTVQKCLIFPPFMNLFRHSSSFNHPAISNVFEVDGKTLV